MPTSAARSALERATAHVGNVHAINEQSEILMRIDARASARWSPDLSIRRASGNHEAYASVHSVSGCVVHALRRVARAPRTCARIRVSAQGSLAARCS